MVPTLEVLPSALLVGSVGRGPALSPRPIPRRSCGRSQGAGALQRLSVPRGFSPTSAEHRTSASLVATAIESSAADPAPAAESSASVPAPAAESSASDPAPAAESSAAGPAPAVESTVSYPTIAAESSASDPTAAEFSASDPAPAVESSASDPAPAAESSTADHGPELEAVPAFHSSPVPSAKPEVPISIPLPDPGLATVAGQMWQGATSASAPGAAPSSSRSPASPRLGASFALPTACTSISTVARALIAAFSITLLYGGILSFILTASPSPLLASIVLCGFLIFSASKPLRNTNSQEPSKLLSAVLGYLSFTTAPRLLSGHAFLSLPPYLIVVFCAATYVAFLHPNSYYKLA